MATSMDFFFDMLHDMIFYVGVATCTSELRRRTVSNFFDMYLKYCFENCFNDKISKLVEFLRLLQMGFKIRRLNKLAMESRFSTN